MLFRSVIPGYVFEGWFTEAAGGTEVTKDTKINEAQDLYAHWAEGYAVTFDPNSGQIDGKDDPKVVKLGKLEKIAKKDVPLNEKLTREDYIFAGWNTKANGTGIMLADPDAVVGHEFNYTSATLYAQWTANGTEQVTVTFDGNGATTEANPTSITLNKGDKIGTGMPDEPKRTNYKFKEWNTKQNGTGDEFTGEIEINETQKVYAQWEAEGNDSEKATVTFKDDGDTHAKPDKITIRKGDKIGKGNMPNAPIKAEYVFDKWIVDADKNGKIDNGETTEFTGDEIVADDMQVVAAWKSDVTVTFHVRNGQIDGESLATKEITVKYGNSLENEGKALPVATSNAEGYVFWGWKTKDNGGGDEFKVDTAVVKDIDVYALFQKADPPDGPGEEPKPKENAVKKIGRAHV